MINNNIMVSCKAALELQYVYCEKRYRNKWDLLDMQMDKSR